MMDGDGQSSPLDIFAKTFDRCPPGVRKDVGASAWLVVFSGLLSLGCEAGRHRNSPERYDSEIAMDLSRLQPANSPGVSCFGFQFVVSAGWGHSRWQFTKAQSASGPG
jgi:hypothetical protein